jgi:hypothetical protein
MSGTNNPYATWAVLPDAVTDLSVLGANGPNGSPADTSLAPTVPVSQAPLPPATLGDQSSADDPGYEKEIQAASAATGVPPAYIKAVMMTESGGKNGQTSNQNAQGLMQLEPDTFAGLGGKDIEDPAQNIMAGAKYLAQGYKAGNGDWDYALKYFHGGPDQKQWGPITQNYVGLVNKNLGLTPNPPADSSQVAMSDDDWVAKQAASLNGTATASDSGPGDDDHSDWVAGQANALKGATPGTTPTAPAAAQPLSNAQQAQLAQLKQGNVSGVAPAAVAPAQAPSAVPAGASPGGLVNGPASDVQPYVPPKPVVQAPVAAAPGTDVTPQWDGLNAWVNGITLGDSKSLGLAAKAGAAIGAGYSALTGGAPFSQSYDANTAQLLQEQQAYNKAHPGNAYLSSTVGPIIGGTAAGEIGGPLLGVAGDAVPAIRGATSFLSGAGGYASKVVNSALSGAAGSAATAENQTDGPNAGQSAALGGLVGGAASGVLGPFGRAVLPGVRSGIDTITDGLRALGVEPPTGAIADNGLVRMAAGQATEKSYGQWVGAWRKLIGLNDDNATLPIEDVETAERHSGATIQALSQQLPINGGQPLNNLFNNMVQLRNTLAPNLGTMSQDAVRKINGGFAAVQQGVLQGNGTIPGSYVANLWKKSGAIWNMQHDADVNVRNVGTQLRQLLDQGVQDSAQINGNSNVYTSYLGARNQYRTALGLENAATAASDGRIDPRAVATAFKNEQTGTPADILARAGRGIISKPGTVAGPQTPAALKFLAAHGAASVLGLATAAMHGNPLAGAAVGLGVEGAQNAIGFGTRQFLNSNYYNGLLRAGAQMPVPVSAGLGNTGAAVGGYVNPYEADQGNGQGGQ